MSLTSYERLRMTHRTLLQRPSAAPVLHRLLAELPTHLDHIVADRPALKDEVETTRQYLDRIAAYVATAPAVDQQRVAEGLHRALSPLFPGQ
ncbi:MAG TPA: hypothetical protein VF630_03605 [Hymenobacter sp.]|jgi:hypothetical protein